MKILLVEWVDSSYIAGWKDKKDFDVDLAKCFSTGLAIDESDDAITLVLSGGDTGQWSQSMTIPKVAIKRIRELKVKDTGEKHMR